jgi:hypothetical protein
MTNGPVTRGAETKNSEQTVSTLIFEVTGLKRELGKKFVDTAGLLFCPKPLVKSDHMTVCMGSL